MIEINVDDKHKDLLLKWTLDVEENFKYYFTIFSKYDGTSKYNLSAFPKCVIKT